MFAQRLRELRKRGGVSQAALASLLGVTQQAVGKWEAGRATPDPQTLARIAAYFSVSADYLLGSIPDPAAPGLSVVPFERGHLIPIIGTVRAGFGALAFEEDCGEEYANVKDPDHYFYLVVQGDSMEPRISDGDLALVRRQNTLENGELGVMVCGDGAGTLNKFVRRGNTVILQPFNPDYAPQIYTGEAISEIHIVGKVISTVTKTLW